MMASSSRSIWAGPFVAWLFYTTPAHNKCGSDRTPKSHGVRFFGRSIRSALIVGRLVGAQITLTALNYRNTILAACFHVVRRKSSNFFEKQDKNMKKSSQNHHFCDFKATTHAQRCIQVYIAGSIKFLEIISFMDTFLDTKNIKNK
jgi:hypothetical protein